MKSSYLLAGLAALVLIGGQSVTASAAEAYSHAYSRHHVSMYRQTPAQAERFFATTVRPHAPSPSSSGSLGFIGSSEAGN